MIRPAAAWEEIRRPDSRQIILMDNNVLASDHGLEQIDRMGGKPVWVDFNQGLDARLISPETAKLLARLHWIRFIRLSCDTSAMLPVIQQATAYLREAGAAPLPVLVLCAGAGCGGGTQNRYSLVEHRGRTICPHIFLGAGI